MHRVRFARGEEGPEGPHGCQSSQASPPEVSLRSGPAGLDAARIDDRTLGFSEWGIQIELHRRLHAGLDLRKTHIDPAAVSEYRGDIDFVPFWPTVVTCLAVSPTGLGGRFSQYTFPRPEPALACSEMREAQGLPDRESG